MTTRAELLDAFEAKLAAEGSFLLPVSGANVMPDQRSYIHEAYDSLDGQRIVEWHVCRYWDDTVDNVEKAQFYVKDRGEPGEEAKWFRGTDPKPDPADATFQQEMLIWINSQIDQALGASTLRHVEGVTANNLLERGTVNAIMETGTGDFVRRSAAVWKDASEVWQFKVITE